MYLPQSAPGQAPAQTWDDNEWSYAHAEATADDAGAAVVQFATVGQGRRWLVDRVVVLTDTGPGTAGTATFWLYLDSVEPRQLVDMTDAGDFDVNDANSPIEVPAGSRLIGRWTGAAAGVGCTVTLHYLEQTTKGKGS